MAPAQPSGSTRTAEGVVGGGHLVRHVIDNIGAVRDAGEILVHDKPHQPVGMRVGHIGGRIDVDPAVIGEAGVDGDAHHAGLAFAEQIVLGAGIAFAAAHAEKGVHGAVRHQNRQAFAFLGEEHGAVIEERHVPRVLQPVEHDAVLKAARVGSGLRRRNGCGRCEQRRCGDGHEPTCGFAIEVV